MEGREIMKEYYLILISAFVAGCCVERIFDDPVALVVVIAATVAAACGAVMICMEGDVDGRR